jgi:hypothetical protein
MYYAIQGKKHIAAPWRARRPGIVIEIRWCPAHKGAPGNERATLAAEEPDSRGVEWFRYADRFAATPQLFWVDILYGIERMSRRANEPTRKPNTGSKNQASAYNREREDDTRWWASDDQSVQR